METAAVNVEPEEQSSCWCCGAPFEDSALTRLGAHPEVGICSGCARWLSRRARLGAERRSGTPAAVLRRGIHRAREAVIRIGVHEWPGLGPLLKGLDRHLS